MFERFYPGMQWADHKSVWPHAQHSRFLQANGIDWHVQTLGQGPCMLLLHGTGSGNFSWRGLLEPLSRHYSVVAPDLPGHAFTSRGEHNALSLPGMSAALRNLLRQLDLQPQVIVGHSAGAAIAAHMVLNDSTLANTTVIGLNPAWLPLPGAAAWLFGPAAKLAALNPWSAWAIAKMATKPGSVASLIAGTGSTLDPEGVALYTRLLADSGHLHGVLSMMAQWDLPPLSDALHRIRNPVFMDIGAQDQAIPPQLADEACRRIKHAEKNLRVGVGHLAHEEDPAGTVQQILRWCGRP